MTKDEIIKLARDAGLEWNGYWEFDMNRFETFANLVAAELRRLHAVNQELLKACRTAIVALKGREHDGFLRAAIAKAEGEQT
jgi:hypothetical protein